MEGIISSMEEFQLLRILSFTPMAEFPRETYVQLHMALLFSGALAFCFWGFVVAWWRKYAQSVFVLSLSPCLSFNFNATRHRIQIDRVSAMVFALDRVSHINSPTTNVPAEENENSSKGKYYMRFESSIESPEELPAHDFSQNREASVADCEDYRNYEEESLERPKKDLHQIWLLSEEIVKCFDVSQSREMLAASTVDSINTVRVWDVQERKCVNYMKFDDTSVVAGARFPSSPNLNLLSGIGIAEHSCSLYVWDTRNFPKPLSFSLGKKPGFDIVEFNDEKVYVCDDLRESVFDLRMTTGTRVLEVNPRRDRLTASYLTHKETGPQFRKSCNLQDFRLQ